jgi:hypothetical protein
VAEIIQQHKQLSDRWKILEITDQILSLFPPQLTEEEVEKILPKKRICPSHTPPQYEGCARCDDNWFYNKAIDDCKTALIGKCGATKDQYRVLWDICDEFNLGAGGCPDNLIREALRATPTFSGGEKKVDFEIQRKD